MNFLALVDRPWNIQQCVQGTRQRYREDRCFEEGPIRYVRPGECEVHGEGNYGTAETRPP